VAKEEDMALREEKGVVRWLTKIIDPQVDYFFLARL
jgi:hypothetical protein